MPQVIFTPGGIYKYFRNLVIGHSGGGAETDGFYISPNIGTTIIKNLAYFKVGVGGPQTSEITKEFFDSAVGAEDHNYGAGYASGCKDHPSSADTKGDLNIPIPIYATDPEGYGSSRYKKALVSANFMPYGTSNSSKVIGVLSVVSGATGKHWDIPGVAFQVSCQLLASEGNFDWDGKPGSAVAVSSPDVVLINEIGIFDVDDVMILYGAFPQRSKNNTLTFKANAVAMLKALDYQLTVLPTTTSSTTSSSTSSSSSSSSSSTSSTSSSSSSSSSTVTGV